MLVRWVILITQNSHLQLVNEYKTSVTQLVLQNRSLCVKWTSLT